MTTCLATCMFVGFVITSVCYLQMLQSWQALEDSLDNDESYAERNKKRETLVQREVSKPTFYDKVIVVDLLMCPVDHDTNYLLRRSRLLGELAFLLPEHNPTRYEEVSTELRSSFLQVVSGTLGEEAVKDYVKSLNIRFKQICPELSSPAPMAMTFFRQTIFAMSDVWRKLCHAFMCPPFDVFALLDVDFETFADRWRLLRGLYRACPQCVDIDFTTVLLEMFGDLDGKSAAEQLEIFHQVVNLLKSIATYCPLTSDSTEIRHGQVQADAQRFVGHRKTKESIVEETALANLARFYESAKQTVNSATMPDHLKLSHMIRKVGVSDPSFAARRSDKKTKDDRISEAKSRKVRRLSGWNVFFKEKQEGGQQLSEEGYANSAKALGAAWQNLPEDDRQAYEVEARYRNDCIAELKGRPLASASATETELGETVQQPSSQTTKYLEEIAGKSCRKVSFIRLTVNEQERASHPAWTKLGLGLSDASGALRREFVEQVVTEEECATKLQATIHSPLNPIDLPPDDSQVHNEVCHIRFGQCRHSPFAIEAAEFSKYFGPQLVKHNLASGSLLQMKPVGVDQPCEYLFLGLIIKKPSSQILVKAHRTSPTSFSVVGHATLPQFMTATQLFQRWLTRHADKPFSAVAVKVLNFTVDALSPQSLLEVQLETDLGGDAAEFVFRACLERKAKPTKQKNTLPFGLKMPPRKRKAKPQPRTTLGQAIFKKVRGNLSFTERAKGNAGTSHSDTSAAACDPVNASESDSSTSSSSASSSSSSSASDVVLDKAKESEEVAPPNPSDAAELQRLRMAEEQLCRDRQQRAELAAQARMPFNQRHSFELGFAEVSTAPTSQAKCMCCQQVIIKGSIRLSYFWNTKRPNRYIHEYCVARFCRVGSPDVVATKKQQAIRALTGLMILPTVTEAMRTALDFQLMQLRGGSSSSSS
jgi:hypothetical protein